MSLYRDDILDHYHHPQNFGKPERFTHSCEQGLQACGDRQIAYLMVENDLVMGAWFEGNGCAISTAATSLLTELLKGKTIDQLKLMNQDDIVALLGSPIAAGRVNCAMLGLRSFQKAVGEN